MVAKIVPRTFAMKYFDFWAMTVAVRSAVGAAGEG